MKLFIILEINNKNIMKQQRITTRQQNWKKFGKAALETNGQTSWKTKESFELFLGTPQEHIEAHKTKKDKAALENLYKALMSGTYEFDDLVKVYDDIVDEKYERALALKNTSKPLGSSQKSSIEVTGYVPPHLRNNNANDINKPGDTKPGDTKSSTILNYKKPPGFAIRMFDVPDYISENDIWGKCSVFGKISRINFLKDKDTGEFRGIVFVNFYSKEDSNECVKILNNTCWEGFVIRLEVDKRTRT